MYHLRHQKYKIEHTEVKHLNSILKNRILKIKKHSFRIRKILEKLILEN